MDVSNGHPAVLEECRDLVTARLRTTVERVVEEAALSLERQTLGGPFTAPGAAQFDVVRELRQRRGEFAVRFEHCYRDIFERRMTADAAAPVVNPALSAVCRSLLLEIDRRLEGLVNGARVPSAAGLIEPDVLATAFESACNGFADGDEVRRTLRELFQRQVQLELPRVYGEVNSLLVRQGIRVARPVHRESPAAVPFATFPGRRPTVYSQGRSRQVAPPDNATLEFVRKVINAHVVPYFVRAFAQDSWARVLSRIRVEKGEDSAEWVRAVKTLEDLVTTMEMFEDADTRRLAIWGLPGLVQRLKNGMTGVNIPQQEQVLFLKTLRAHQLRVLGQRASSGAPLSAPEEDGED